MIQKGFTSTSILALVVLAAIGYFGYKNFGLLTRNFKTTPIATPFLKTDMTNWKTYTNSKYKITFKYPKSYTVVETNNHYGIANRWALTIEDTEQKTHGVEENDIINKPIFYIMLTSDFKYDPDANTAKSNLKIGDNMFKYFEATKYEMYEVHYFEIGKFIVVSEMENLHKTNPTFDQVLSTFKVAE